ncbi:MAG: hypothetical protein GXO57_09210 [Thermodesulfobacteria bacterium]|nr:hypothetical protein [Thermodesulfobacteriota bacterium]
MQKLTKLCILFLVFSAFKIGFCSAAWLVKFKDGSTYTVKDFCFWWKNWRNSPNATLQTIDPYIKWLLFLKEAKKMDLENSYAYREKVLIYRKVRDLLHLQYDEVESKIHITDKALWHFYEKNFKPIYVVKNFYFKKKSKATSFMKKLKSLKDCEKLFKNSPDIWKGYFWVRPWSCPNTAKSVLFKQTLPSGSILGPVKWNKVWAVVCIEKTYAGGKKDYLKIKAQLKHIYQKMLEDKLTDELIRKLKKKYKIQFNATLYSKIGFTEVPKALKNKILLRIADRFLTAEGFHEMLLKEYQFRFAMVNPKDEKSVSKFKKFVLNSIIAQNLVEIEALNRGYEKQEPFKRELNFYKKNLLVKEFVNFVILPKLKVTDEDVKKFIKEHENMIGWKRLVTAVFVQTSQKSLVEKVKEELLKGRELEDILDDLGFANYVTTQSLQDYPLGIRKDIWEAPIGKVLFLKTGRYYCIIKVLKKEKLRRKITPEVKWKIKNFIARKKFEKLEKALYEKLEKSYAVKVNSKLWNSIKGRLGSVCQN